MTQRPSFDELPLQKDGPHGNAWGLYGDKDQCGMLNLLTPEKTKSAALEIQQGIRLCLDWPLNQMKFPCFNRVPLAHNIKNKAPRCVNDDSVSFNTQSSTQWDGFRHYGYQKERLFFNGASLDDVLNTSRIGTHVWVENGGIVGRGVLLDYARWAEDQQKSYDCFSAHAITVDDLEKIIASQNVTINEGDIIFIRSGWGKEFLKLSEAQLKELADKASPPAIGMESSRNTLKWLWDNKVSAVAGDMPSFEAWPCQNQEYWLHEWLLAGWGMPIGELFNLEELSRACESNKRWSFFFSSVPIYVPGGVASPPNSVAIM